MWIFQLPQGETLALIGESGSGKTTLGLAVIAAFSRTRRSGDAGANGICIVKAGTRQWRRHAQIVFQDPYSSLSPRMTMSEILQEGLQLHEPQLDESQRLARIVAVLQEVGLTADVYRVIRMSFRWSATAVGDCACLGVTTATVVVRRTDFGLGYVDSGTSVGLAATATTKIPAGLLIYQPRFAGGAGSGTSCVGVKTGPNCRIWPCPTGIYTPQHPYTQSLLRAAGL